MMKKKQSIIALVLAAIVTVLLGWTMIKGWGPTGTGSMKNINLGLDLSGGVSITYQAVKDNPTDEEMSDTLQAGTACAAVQRRGTGISAGRQPYHH